MAHIVQLIYTREFRGVGTKEDPSRSVPQLWTLDGKLVAEQDDTDGLHDRRILNLHQGALDAPPEMQR